MLHFKQSPINIKTDTTIMIDRLVEFNYNSEEFHVMNTGLNISLMPTNAKSYILKNNKKYHLSEMHFHRPIEHHVDGNDFDMEVHLVHQESHETVVYSVLLNIADSGFDFGKPFENIDSNITIDLKTLTAKKCWDYHGSFTTSPFNEVVIWLINQESIDICSSQANLINSFYPQNNRCLQPINDRNVYTVCTCLH